jgi:hypothetical protein
MKVPDLRNPNFIGEPKHVDQTKMLDGNANESVDYNEMNDNKERVVSHPGWGELGAKGRE